MQRPHEGSGVIRDGPKEWTKGLEDSNFMQRGGVIHTYTVHVQLLISTILDFTPSGASLWVREEGDLLLE